MLWSTYHCVASCALSASAFIDPSLYQLDFFLKSFYGHLKKTLQHGVLIKHDPTLYKLALAHLCIHTNTQYTIHAHKQTHTCISKLKWIKHTHASTHKHINLTHMHTHIFAHASTHTHHYWTHTYLCSDINNACRHECVMWVLWLIPNTKYLIQFSDSNGDWVGTVHYYSDCMCMA